MNGLATGNRLLICVIAAVVFLCIAAAFALDYTGRAGSGAFIGAAATALGVLAPSALKQVHTEDKEGGDGSGTNR